MDPAAALKLHDDLLASKPEGARHDSDICQFCVEKASDPSGSGRPGVSDKSDKSKNTEGGDTPTMADISQEAHEALLNAAVTKAVAEATKTTEAALATKTTEAAEAVAKVTELETTNAGLVSDNERLNKDLDAAQVKITAASEEVATLKQEATAAAEQASLTEVATKRGDQIKNLKLFPDEYVAEKASKWASLSDEAWGEQVEEWKRLKPASGDSAGDGTDSASAMSGTSESLTKEQQDAAAAGAGKTKSTRRAALGLA